MKTTVTYEDILDGLINQIPYAIFWKDNQFVFRGCNQEFAKQFDLKSEQDVIGKTDLDFPFPANLREKYRNDDAEVLKGTAKLNYEEEQKQLDGSINIVLVSKTPLYNKNKQIVGILGIYTDITQRKHQENELAEASNKAKSEFIANMSHDIRTPITGMVGMIEELINTIGEVKSDLTTEKVLPNSEWLQIATHIETTSNILKSSTEQLLQLCNEILEITRLDSGIKEKPPEPFDLLEILNKNVNLLTPFALHKQLNLSVHAENNVPRFLTGLKEYLNRTILNLLSNSLKFTNKGHVNLIVRCKDKLEKKYKIGDVVNIQIIVNDTGIGIPEDKYDIIFEHFSRLSPSYEGVYTGSGLGLYTVKRYVEAMAGQIELKSQVDVGTTFTITAPFIVANDDTIAVQSLQILNTRIAPPSIVCQPSVNIDDKSIEFSDSKSMRILIVEDNAIAAMTAKIIFKPYDCHIDIAANGEVALNKVNENDYHLIFMDIGLPDISGIKVAQNIRALRAEKSLVPIVALTGHADDEVTKECLAAGMQEVQLKPLTAIILELILKKYVNIK